MSICEDTTLDRILRPSTTTAAAVSSHDDSIPSIRASLFASVFMALKVHASTRRTWGRQRRRTNEKGRTELALPFRTSIFEDDSRILEVDANPNLHRARIRSFRRKRAECGRILTRDVERRI